MSYFGEKKEFNIEKMKLIVIIKIKVYLDVIEKVNMTINANGNVVKSEILGCLKMRS